MRSKKPWKVGDLFQIPIAENLYTLGQVIGLESEMPNCPICAFSSKKAISSKSNADCNLAESNIIAVLFVTRDLLDSGTWQICRHTESAVNPAKYFDLERLRRDAFVGLKVIGSGNVTLLMQAYFGLYPWNKFHQENYLDSLLVSPSKKPSNVVLE